MSSNDALSDRQMLERITNQLDRQGKTLKLRFYLSIAITFIILSLTVCFASLSLGMAVELRWLILMLFLGGLLIICWASLDFRQNYRKSFAVSGSVLLVAGVLGWAILLPYLFPFISSPARIIGVLLINLAVILGVILMSLAPRRISKKGT
jgi:hypothetical protein